MRLALSLLAFGALLWSSGRVWAHDDPAAKAGDVTAAIEAHGPTVEALTTRAELWRSLRKLDLAIEDLKEACALAPNSVGLKRRLARTQYAHNALKPAFETVKSGLAIAEKAEDRASLLMLRASIYLAWRSYENAVSDCDAADEALPNHHRVDWVLYRAFAQRMTGAFEACERDLKAALTRTRSAVIHAQWVDALIDVKRYEEVIREVDRQLPGLRFSAAWRLRKGQALLGLEQPQEARSQFMDALKELDGRIRPHDDYPDTALLSDRGLAHWLLGNRKAARSDYERAKKAGAFPWMHWRLEKTFG